MIISSNYSFTFTYFNWHPPNGKKVEKSTIKFFTIIIKHTVPNTNLLFKIQTKKEYKKLYLHLIMYGIISIEHKRYYIGSLGKDLSNDSREIREK